MKLVFYGLTAFVRSFTNGKIYFSTENPSQNPNMFVPLDLDLTPAAAEHGRIPWGEVVVDDFGEQDAKRTTVDPRNGGRRKGAVWVEEAHLALLRRLFSLPVPHPKYLPAKVHEFMSVRYYAEDSSGDAHRVGNRYLGYEAEILDKAARKVRIYHAGSGGHPAAKPPVEVSGLDFDDPEKCDYPTTRDGMTEIGVTAGMPTTGALYLKDDYASSLSLSGPKKPPGEGL